MSINKLFGCTILSLTLTLPGCLPAAFVAGAATGTVIYDQRSSKTILSDNQIAMKLRKILQKDEMLHDSKAHISLSVFNQIVLVVGQVQTNELREHAEKLIRQEEGIKLVYNELTVEQATGTATRAHDSWITTKTKTILMATPGLNSSTLKIVTENGVVYLMGLTIRSQGTLAAQKASTVSGVKRVVKLFEYQS